MNLETQVRPELWSAIRSSYELRSFTSAILDAVYYISDLIREKSGLEADGVALVGQAFGGDRPKLRVNKLLTESERNVQRGIEQILRGLYQAVRNPRSHEKHVDSEADADALILFINYLCTVIDQSKTPFTRSEFLMRVFDADFVPSDRYAALLVADIPGRQRLEVFREVWNARETGNRAKLKVFFAALLGTLNEVELDEVRSQVSDELKSTNSDATIRLALCLLPADFWSRYEEVDRLRIENKLLSEIKRGRYDPSTKACVGALGTWAEGIASQFVLKDELIATLLRKLETSDRGEQAYVFQYFFSAFPRLMDAPSPRYVRVGLQQGNTLFRDALDLIEFLAPAIPDDPWHKPFVDDFQGFVENAQDVVTEDDIPF